MTNKAIRNLSKEKIQQILDSVGIESEEDTMHNIDAFDYNWHQPNYFSRNQLEQLGGFTKKMAHICSEKFSQLFNSEFNVTIASTTQHFADEIINSDDVKNDHYLTLGTKEKTFGLVCIPSQTARIWSTQLLGDVKSAENSDRDLSQLEMSLLFDVASGIVAAFSDSYDNYDLSPLGDIVNGRIPIELEGTEEFCKITFSVEDTVSENSSSAYFLIFCDKLQTVAGQKTQVSGEISSEIIAKAMLDHVHKTPVTVTAQLASAKLTFEELMSLQVGDTLVLDKIVNEPAELVLEGKTILYGQPVKSDGQHALLITELICTE